MTENDSVLSESLEMASCSRYDYISEPEDELKCLICLDVAEDPLQHEACGKLFCKECIEKHGRDKPCPNCKVQGSKYYEDKRSQRNVLDLHVRCNNASRDCEWEGTVDLLQKHLAVCQSALVPCPKACEISEIVRKDLYEHLKKDCPNRDYKCKHCGEIGAYTNMTQLHDETCEKKVLPCPNDDCSSNIQRRNLKRHIESCKHTELPCKYRRLGCDTKMKRDVLSTHEAEEKLHFRMALDKVTTMEEKMLTMQEKMATLEEKAQVDSKPFKVNNFQSNRDNKSISLFSTSHLRYRMAMEVYANGRGQAEGTHVSIFAKILQGRHDANLKWPITGDLTFTLLNQLHDKNHFSRRVPLGGTRDARVGTTWGKHRFIPHSALAHDPVKNTQYIKDDTLYFRVSLEVADCKPWLECTPD